jgi:cation diffusion facilitator family transporter
MNKNSKQEALRAGWLSILVNTLIFGLKYWAGIVTGSIAIIADAWHTLSDSISSIVLIIGVRASSKEADEEHPFGHGRAELIAAIIIGVFLALIAFSFIEKSINQLMGGKQVVFGTIAIVATVISIFGKEALAQYAFHVGRKANSPALKADGWHHRSDAISSIIILIGIFLGKYFWWIDGLLGILVAVLIFYAAFTILRDSISPILGTSPDADLVKKLKQICADIGGPEIDAHHFHLHDYGFHAELTFHIYLPNQMRLENVHYIATEIEDKIREEFELEATVHVDPLEEKE